MVEEKATAPALPTGFFSISGISQLHHCKPSSSLRVTITAVSIACNTSSSMVW